MATVLGYTRFGNGATPVLVLHDWFCDHSSWEAALPYLTPAAFTYVFADLRGYGLSGTVRGECTLEEACGDVIALADDLEWSTFSLIGHSMSGLIVQRLAQLVPDRIRRIAAVTPVPPSGLHLDSQAVDMFRSLALADDEARFSVLSGMWGTRLSDTWIRYKLRRWRETAEPDALAKYVELWGCTDIASAAQDVRTPMLIVGAAQDAPPFQASALEASTLPSYPNARVISLDSGHYPMQELPPLLTTALERFLSE